MRHGALDVDAIRRIDLGEETANQAFLHAGVGYTMPESERLRTIAMFAAMECAGLLLLAPDATVVLAGSLAPGVADEVVEPARTGPSQSETNGPPPAGLVRIARDVFGGADEILGIPVDRSAICAGKRFILIYHVRLRDAPCRSYASTAEAARARSRRPN